MDITPIFVCAIVFGCIYKIFELFVRKNERLRIIDKVEQIGALPAVDTRKLTSLFSEPSDNRFTALRWGLLAVGIGIGLVCYVTASVCESSIRENWKLESTLCSALVLLGGGLGLVIAFIIENKLRNKHREEE